MDIEMLIERLRTESLYADKASLEIMDLCMAAATAFSKLQAENEQLKDQLYDGEGVNLVNYWIQQAKIEENGHRNCQAENEKLRVELEQVKRCIEIVENQRDAAIKELENYMVQDVLDGNEPCGICAKASDIPCEYCNPKWRGPKED